MNDLVVGEQEFKLTKAQEDDLCKLAAAGLSVAEIAKALEINGGGCLEAFVAAAQTEGTKIFGLIASSRVIAKVQPIIKLQQAATAGSLDAIKTLNRLQHDFWYKEILKNMDNDEYTVQTI